MNILLYEPLIYQRAHNRFVASDMICDKKKYKICDNMKEGLPKIKSISVLHYVLHFNQC